MIVSELQLILVLVVIVWKSTGSELFMPIV